MKNKQVNIMSASKNFHEDCVILRKADSECVYHASNQIIQITRYIANKLTEYYIRITTLHEIIPKLEQSKNLFVSNS